MLLQYSLYILIAFGLGFIIISFGIYLFVKSNNTKRWNETKGVILKSEIERTSTSAGYDGESLSFKASIEYRYKADNHEYSSKRIFYGDKISKPFPFKSKLLVKLYPKDSDVSVYYNPLKPQESVLQRGLNFIVIEIFILGACFVLLGFAILKHEVVIDFLNNVSHLVIGK